MVRVSNRYGYDGCTAYEIPMTTSDTPHDPCSVTLSLPFEEHWMLHHVLLDRIEQEAVAEESSSVDPPPVAVFQAFEALDAGETRFTIAQIEAMQTLLAEYHHAPRWELHRPQLEQLLYRITERIEQHQAALPADC
jgi:hypothetical protein